MKISEHFTLHEAMKSQTAERLGIDNTPPDEIKPAIIQTANLILEPVRNFYGVGFSPSSWFRCLELNRAIGSKDTSQHPKGEAVDFEVPGVSNLEVAAWIREHLVFDQLILEFWTPDDPFAGWVHCSVVFGKNRGEVLTIGKGGTIPGLAGG